MNINKFSAHSGRLIKEDGSFINVADVIEQGLKVISAYDIANDNFKVQVQGRLQRKIPVPYPNTLLNISPGFYGETEYF